MADITLSYKGSTIAEISDSATKTMNTAGKYCEDDITLVYVKPQAGAQFTITVSVDSGSTVTATDGTTTVTGTSVNDECVLTIPNAATWTVTATLNGMTATVTVVVMQDYPVPLAYADPVLANNTPAQIQKVAQAGTGANFWSVGDKTSEIAFKNVTIGSLSFNGIKACAFILGFNHNSSIEGTGIHFQLGQTSTGTNIAFCDSGYGVSKTSGTWFNMNNSNSNSGGWKESRMRTQICQQFGHNAFPTDWHDVIAACTKYTHNANGESTYDLPQYTNATTDYIFLLSEFEVHGVRTVAPITEQNYQQQYAYYANGNSKVKYKHSATTTTCFWWLRSIRTGAVQNYCQVSTNGGVYSGAASYSNGFSPAFMIG